MATRIANSDAHFVLSPRDSSIEYHSRATTARDSAFATVISAILT